jgi:predicted metal-dependent hydrolase
MIEQYFVQFGKTRVFFSLKFSLRKTLAIHVYPEGLVEVVAPLGTKIEDIQLKVLKRAGWILDQIHTFGNYPPALPKKQFISGETVRYLGRQYRLKIIKSEIQQVRFYRGTIIANIRNPNEKDNVERHIRTWFKCRAREIISERMRYLIPIMNSVGIHHSGKFSLKQMNKRWGSCSRKAQLVFNPELIAAPRACIDYVIIHELCHLKELNHNGRFYALLTKVMPDWEVLRAKLNQTVEVRFY